ncbi:MAG: glycosyltransferase family 2 protein [Candidatus Nealsonbacteria bacterium]|nr:glycosyltransferase family 2 protein [Candidatus Nealsonbacteria bacterium]
MTTHYVEKENSPLVSIVMSVYNGERFLKESIDSLLNQTYKNIEIILVNDGSTDRTREIASSFQDERIVFIDRNHNLGLTKSLNEGLQYVHGDYIARLDVGDVALPTRIKEQVNFLEGHPEIGIIGSGIELFYNNQTLKKYIYAPNHKTIKKQLLRFVNPLPHSTLMIRAEIIKKLNGYCEAFLRSQDYDLLLRGLNVTKLASLPKVLVRWRFDPLSLSYGSSQQLKYGIAALVRAHHYLRGHRDIAEKETWPHILEDVETFIQKYRLDKKISTGKYRLLFQFSLFEHRWRDSLGNAIKLIIYNPLFFIDTRTRLSAFIAAHIEELISC